VNRSYASSPFRPQKIRLVDPDDPQLDANPEPAGRGLELYTRDIHHTVQLMGERMISLFAEDPTVTRAAIFSAGEPARSVGGRGACTYLPRA